MKNKNTDGIQAHNKMLQEQKKQDVIKAINILRRSNRTFTLSALCKQASVSRSYFQKNPEMLKLVDKYRKSNGCKKIQTQDAKDVIINSLKNDNKRLKNELKAIEINDNYKIKYEELKKEIEKLSKELEEALKMNLDLDF